MPVNAPALTKALKAQVKALESDLLARLEGDLAETTKADWRTEYDAAVANERMGLAWSEFVADRVTQAAVAWVLTTVFIRFCEDNGLLSKVWITGSGPRGAEAVAREQEFIRAESATNFDVNARHWLLDAFAYLKKTPATALLVDSFSPVWSIEPSAYACRALLDFWREVGADDSLTWGFTDPTLDTRFLGDLYQDLSDAAKKKYALLQTPEFVEEFILSRTLVPALKEVHAREVRVIDPTCGSGHFLLGAFAMICARLREAEPGMTSTARAQSALDSVAGVDLNPFAVAISRFRLLVAAQTEAAGEGGFSLDTNAHAFTVRVAVGDSLLHGEHVGAFVEGELDLSGIQGTGENADFVYAAENLEALNDILRLNHYDVVVGNPPYITVKDKVLNTRYRRMYTTCHMKYALSVPFMQRFFQLAKRERGAGWVGQITSNSFMKREFGSKLIENFLKSVVDVTEVMDTSGAYIPGHGTPTVIVIGRNRDATAKPIRAALGKQGEPGAPADAAKGLVWTAITSHIDQPGHDGQWVSVADVPREQLATHPWSLSGGAASQLSIALSRNPSRIFQVAQHLGIVAYTGEDDAYVIQSKSIALRKRWARITKFVEGNTIRDWDAQSHAYAAWTYNDDFQTLPIEELGNFKVDLFVNRTLLNNRKRFSRPMRELALCWYEWKEIYFNKLVTPLSIAFAEVATHNHFVLDRGGKVFNRTAPVMKLPEGATEDQHLELLGVLNSSTACFWLKENCHNKGAGADSKGARQTSVPFENFYQFNGTTLQDFPLPPSLPLEPARTLDRLAQGLAEVAPGWALASETDPVAALQANEQRDREIRERMIALQEELDWQVYQSYRLTEHELTAQAAGVEVPGVRLGERAFEIALARRVAAGEASGEWFTRHGSAPLTEIPERWPAAYRDLVQRRLDALEADPNLNLLERPEYKRRWVTKTWAKRQADAARDWVLDQCEARDLWFDDDGHPQTRTTNQVIDAVLRRPHVDKVLAYTHGGDAHELLATLLEPESVPYLAAYRYKESGLRKRADWEHTWALQRQEDAGEIDGATIPVPPKYGSVDFAKPSYWSNRGKLDVPKERFILYPDAGPVGDASPVLGWAGWDHTEQALALVQLYGANEDDNRPDERLLPLAAGLEELEPWLQQWHGEYDEKYSGSPAEQFSAQLDEYTSRLGVTRADLHAWRPPAPTRTRKARS